MSSPLIIIIINTRIVSLQQWLAVRTSKFATALVYNCSPSFLFSLFPCLPSPRTALFLSSSSLLSAFPPPLLPPEISLASVSEEGNFLTHHHHHQHSNRCHHSRSIYFSPSSRDPYIKHSASSLQ